MKTPVVGTILLPEGPLLIASSPILPSNQQGPVQGTLITGRFLDSTELAFLLKTTQLPLVVQVIADSPISSDFQTANQSLSRESPILVQPLNDERIAGYALLEDVYENPILILRLDMPRDVYAQTQAGISYATLFLSVIGVAFCLLTMFLLEKFVVSRLTRLSTDVSNIGSSGDLSMRVSETGKDELSSLGEGINKMVSTIGQTQQQLKEDIAKREQTEKELVDTRNYLDSLLNYANAPIIVWDPDFKITRFNHAFECLTGLNQESVMSKRLDILFPKDKKMEAMTHIQRTLAGEYMESVEIPILHKDGTVRTVLWNSANILDPSGKDIIATIAQGQDITERKRMLQRLEEYSQQLERMVEQRTKQLRDTQEQLVKAERLAAIGQVAAMVGHDLRNPLTGISGAAYYLKMKLGPKAEKRMIQMLEIIEKDVQYSNKIITDLMDYSREIKLELTETTPKSIIAESISLIQIPEKVQLADSTLNEPKIKIDIDKMKRVFANFIKNAVEAMPQGGKLTISSRASSNNVEFMLIDSGVGMTKEVSEKIWTPFFTTKAKGMGLGLAICRRIIEAHQGKISVESIVGEGTTFTIAIPIEPRTRVEGGEKVWVNMPESLLSTTTKA